MVGQINTSMCKKSTPASVDYVSLSLLTVYPVFFGHQWMDITRLLCFTPTLPWLIKPFSKIQMTSLFCPSTADLTLDSLFFRFNLYFREE